VNPAQRLWVLWNSDQIEAVFGYFFEPFVAFGQLIQTYDQPRCSADLQEAMPAKVRVNYKVRDALANFLGLQSWQERANLQNRDYYEQNVTAFGVIHGQAFLKQ